ncbi:hypothetical protein ARMGADRAFT_1079817 [Armillaria gallica]|uniref:Uncharacterized protein n=1 Tax=Armillaria gallica TaxID=47427 RepID=A0A2H3DE46_ARMGA|nr:hypothetical protein ARMGADRAFT_1079817 [Armillaria gallica]
MDAQNVAMGWPTPFAFGPFGQPQPFGFMPAPPPVFYGGYALNLSSVPSNGMAPSPSNEAAGYVNIDTRASTGGDAVAGLSCPRRAGLLSHDDAPLPLDKITDTGTQTMTREAQNDNRIPKESIGLAIVILRGREMQRIDVGEGRRMPQGREKLSMQGVEQNASPYPVTS